MAIIGFSIGSGGELARKRGLYLKFLEFFRNGGGLGGQ